MGDIVPFKKEWQIVCRRCKTEEFQVVENTTEKSLQIYCNGCERQLLMDIKYEDMKGGEDGKG